MSSRPPSPSALPPWLQASFREVEDGCERLRACVAACGARPGACPVAPPLAGAVLPAVADRRAEPLAQAVLHTAHDALACDGTCPAVDHLRALLSAARPAYWAA